MNTAPNYSWRDTLCISSGIRYQVSGNFILPGEPLAIGYFVAPSEEKKMYKMKVKVKVKLINMIMQKFNE